MIRILHLAILTVLLQSLISCSRLRYVSKDFNTLIFIDSSYKIKNPESIEIVTTDENGLAVVTTLTSDSLPVSIESFDNNEKRNYIGQSKYWFPSGQLKRIVNYDKINMYNRVKSFYPNGKVKRNDQFKNRKLVLGSCYDSLENEIDHTPYEVEPNIDLGYLTGCVKYPENLVSQGLQEIVILRVFINKEGRIIRVNYDSNNTDGFVKAALKCLLDMKNVVPAYIDGEPIDCWINIPFKFLN